jgi:hypothetical protein
MPFLGILFALGFAPLFEKTPRFRWRRAATIVVLVYSVAIQALGAFCWPSPWTLNDPPYRYRLWDWSDTEIEACIRTGPRIDPAAQRLLNRLGF